MAKFVPPKIQDNPDGWGPCQLPTQFEDMPYQPFSKGDRLGKIADWFGNSYQDRRYHHKYSTAYGSGQQYSYIHEEDESSFQLVDTSRNQRPMYQRNRFNRYNLQRQQRERKQQQTAAKQEVLSKTQKNRERDRLRQQRIWQKNYGKAMQDNRNRQNAPQKTRDASVRVQENWQVLEDMDYIRLQKLNLPIAIEGQDLYVAGSLALYDKRYDRVNTRSDKKLQRMNKTIHSVTTTDDPIIRKLARQGNVFATSAILTTLMCCTRSVYPWDIVVQKVKDKIFLDKRDDSDLDMLSVSETATQPPDEENTTALNSPKNLSMEATYINHNFAQQVLHHEEKFKFDKENPFIGDDEDISALASVAYRYRKFDIGNDLQVVVRCEHDGYVQGASGDKQFITIKALNEWDSKVSGGVDYRTKLDAQRGAVVATELKNNSFKLAKWTAGAILAGSDQLKFGFVSRASPKDSRNHHVLGVQQFKPAEFAQQMNLNMDNAWGILRCILDIVKKLDDGKYLIMKDPNKPMVRVYDIPDNTFESDDDDDESSDEEEESSDDEGNNCKYYLSFTRAYLFIDYCSCLSS
ncbi:eukaryotic translation initiation factor 3 subunit D-like [Watersipora subatra]|uniref:eukaryotic translation initiation factor 3 subunit D-like n=1 Tax=Watersipora subatra TaxID=2589382 RepID=UPI00355C4490